MVVNKGSCGIETHWITKRGDISEHGLVPCFFFFFASFFVLIKDIELMYSD